MLPINREKVIDAIISCPGVSPVAREIAAPLVDAYIEAFPSFPDSACETVAVEQPWRVELAPKTYAVGVIDRIARDERGLFGCEHKTKSAPKIKKDGTPYAGMTEQDWIEEISQSVQVGLYSMALMRCEKFAGKTMTWAFGPATSRILVRACIKSNPVQFWPRETSAAVFEFSEEYHNAIIRGFISKAAQIRAARKESALPYQLPGNHCTNKFRRECEFLPTCRTHTGPKSCPPHTFDTSDPAYAAIRDLDLSDPEIVILSASAYGTAAQCIEAHRIISGGYFPKQSTIDMEVGTVYHAALAEIYRQQMRQY